MLKILEINHKASDWENILFEDNSFFNFLFDLNKRKKLLKISFLTLGNIFWEEITISLIENKENILSQINYFIYENLHSWLKGNYFSSKLEKQNYFFIPKEFVKEIQIDDNSFEVILLNTIENFCFVNVSNEEVTWNKFAIVEKFSIDFFEDRILNLDVEMFKMNKWENFNKESFSVRDRWIFLHTENWVQYIYDPFNGFVK